MKRGLIFLHMPGSPDTAYSAAERGSFAELSQHILPPQQPLSRMMPNPETMQSATKVRPIPQGYHTVTPYLVVNGASKLIDFVKHTFNAVETVRMNGPAGRIAHAEVKIGDSIVMTSDPDPADTYKATSTQLYVYVDNVDTTYQRALNAGATSMSEPKNQFYGDRNANVKDPFGNIWGIATHVEEVSPEEMQKRMKELPQ